MKLIYNDRTYECVSVKKQQNEIAIHTGIIENGEEIVYHIYGNINFDEVELIDGDWIEPVPDTFELDLMADHEYRLCCLELGI